MGTENPLTSVLTILGPKSSSCGYCDGISRRGFLRIGALGMGGVGLSSLLRAESAAGLRSEGRSHKAVILIFLPGGPSHQDMFDLKLDAPAEIRGEFNPIPTSVPGLQICEHLPRMAKVMDQCTVIRSMVGMEDRHESFQTYTGRLNRNQPPGGWPAMGALLAKLQGSADSAIPASVGLAPKMGHVPWSDNGVAGYLGAAYAPFEINKGGGKDDMVLNGVTLDRLADRRTLLASLDGFRREVDTSGQVAGADAYTQQAFGILTSSKLMTALDLKNEDPQVVARYGKGDSRNRDDGAPKLMEQFLVARRLVEAGARCVTLAFSRWDHHGDNFGALRQDLPLFDQGLSALITDLREKGLDRDVSVLVAGEFGRTPTINKDGGRDHWPRVGFSLLAGGGLKHGQVIGSTDRLGGEADSRPTTFGEVHATLYHAMGLDVNKITVPDLSGRPQFLVDPGVQPMKELVG